MANVDGLIPFLLKWEASTTQRKGETLQKAFERAKLRGYANDAADAGGVTLVGITLATYRQYHRGATASDLVAMSYTQWRGILKKGYWDVWKADYIGSQSVANMLVDWVWHSGAKYGVKIPQSLLGVDVDGKVGAKTLAAVNGWAAQADLFARLKSERLAFIDRLCTRGANKKWRAGWRNRVEDMDYENEE